MNSKAANDVERLAKLAFRRKEKCGPIVAQFHQQPKTARQHPDWGLLEKVYAWVLMPFSLWPVDVDGLFFMILEQIKANRAVTKEARLLVDLLRALPSPKEQAAVSAHEHEVQVGSYEKLICAIHKFDFKEAELSQNAEFLDDWSRLKKCFPVQEYRDSKGIIRRRMIQERSFRGAGWKFKWNTKKERFQLSFDAFCHKWVLYGMEEEKPLIQKLSVNITPLGTMVFIPRYWSFDHKRDLNWNEINLLHRSRDVHRQGLKLTSGQLEHQEKVKRASDLYQQAAKAGLRGNARNRWVIGKLGWDARTDERQLRRILAEAKVNGR